MKTVTATFANGEIITLASEQNDVVLDFADEVTTQRASHVEPASSDARLLFHILRFVFGDKGRVSNWTRTWRVLWRVNTAPVGGPILRCGDVYPKLKDTEAAQDIAVWLDRSEAIAAEIKFLDKWFLDGRD